MNPAGGERAKKTKKGFWSREQSLRIAALVVVVLITIAIFFVQGRLRNLESYGYLGVLFFTFLGSATILLPVPGVAAVIAGGWLLNPLIVAPLAALGESLGELTGYMAGYGGQALIEKTKIYARFEKWMKRHGSVTIFLVSAIPNPIFDVVGVIAGSAGFPLWRFLLICFWGKLLKSLGFAFAGAWGIDWLIHFIQG